MTEMIESIEDVFVPSQLELKLLFLSPLVFVFRFHQFVQKREAGI